MGVFYETAAAPESLLPVSRVRSMIEESLKTAPPQGDTELGAKVDEAIGAAKADETTGAVVTALQGQRLLIASCLVLLLVIAGVVTEANGWADSSKAVWALTTTAFGVIVGLLGGESKAK